MNLPFLTMVGSSLPIAHHESPRCPACRPFSHHHGTLTNACLAICSPTETITHRPPRLGPTQTGTSWSREKLEIVSNQPTLFRRVEWDK